MFAVCGGTPCCSSIPFPRSLGRWPACPVQKPYAISVPDIAHQTLSQPQYGKSVSADHVATRTTAALLALPGIAIPNISTEKLRSILC
eukprot:16021-Rhodomonas_salina.2